MIVTLRTERIRTLDDVRAFLEGSEAADITLHDRREAYAFIERTLVRFRYHFGLSRIGKGVVRRFLAKVTGYSPAQLTRLIARQRRTGGIRDRRPDLQRPHLQPAPAPGVPPRPDHGPGDPRRSLLHRGAPQTRPQGRPGFVRVDTVHSGDRDGEKGVFVINMVDEVTQFQQLAAVPRITEYFLVPVLGALITAFPFRVLAFHADNGTEYVNQGRRPAEQASRRPVHQVQAPTLQRQRPGRVQERQRRPQVARTQAQEIPSGPGLHPLRQTPVAARRRGLPEAGRHLRATRPRGPRRVRL